jgi:hypothetical protein
MEAMAVKTTAFAIPGEEKRPNHRSMNTKMVEM